MLFVVITGGFLNLYSQDKILEDEQRGTSYKIAETRKNLLPETNSKEETEISLEEKTVETNDNSSTKIKEEKIKIFTSSDILYQGETLFIKIESEEAINKATGRLGYSEVSFLKSGGGDWIGIIGADVKEVPGRYFLSINVDGEQIKKVITIVKRKFPETKLYVTEELEDKGYTEKNIQENIAETDNPSIYDIFEIYTPEAYFDKPFVYPLDNIEIVGAYGDIRKSGDIRLQHLGVDLDAEEDTPVYAVNSGVVRFTEELINYGKTMIIDHGLGIFSVYLHLNEYKATVGDQVERGQAVASSGNTGYSIAPHLHFSIKLNNVTSMISVDPLGFISTIRKEMD